MKEHIDEMTKDMCECCEEHFGYICKCHTTPCDEARELSEALYNADYRKQEWISVEERLPEKGQHVLCLYPQKDYGSKCVVDYAETADGFFAEQYLFGRPSHWMPLPEPPKMKGGAE